jgi:predicted transcriptional regulator
LKRDYKNVHTDVKALSELEIIQETDEGRITIPWDEIEAHFRFAA